MASMAAAAVRLSPDGRHQGVRPRLRQGGVRRELLSQLLEGSNGLLAVAEDLDAVAVELGMPVCMYGCVFVTGEILVGYW